MIDIHNHILAGIDDGAPTIQDSLDMAKEAVGKGISTVIATPHHQNGYFNNYKKDIMLQVEGLNELLVTQDIPLTVLPGQEVRIYGELLQDLDKGEILTLNHSDYLLLELPFDSIPFYTDQLLADIQAYGLTPIIAHPERNREILEYPEKLYKYVSNGVLTQLTAGSFLGDFGKRIQQCCEQMIRSHFIHFIASDAHNIDTRRFQLREAYEEVKVAYGEEIVRVFQENSYLLTENMNINRSEPIQIKQKRNVLDFFKG